MCAKQKISAAAGTASGSSRTGGARSFRSDADAAPVPTRSTMQFLFPCTSLQDGDFTGRYPCTSVCLRQRAQDRPVRFWSCFRICRDRRGRPLLPCAPLPPAPERRKDAPPAKNLPGLSQGTEKDPEEGKRRIHRFRLMILQMDISRPAPSDAGAVKKKNL